MEYVRRTYRERLRAGGRHAFEVSYRETDLWIAVDRASFDARMIPFADRFIRTLRGGMERYLADDPAYVRALTPYFPRPEAPEILHAMARAASSAGIGPMSAVAGAVARATAEALRGAFPLREVVVENGGDIHADLRSPLDIAVFAGESPLSERVGLHIDAGEFPLGICTSAGTVGPSLSFGRADAVMVVCRDALLADSYATAFANAIRTEADVNGCVERAVRCDGVLAVLAVMGRTMGVAGRYALRIFD